MSFDVLQMLALDPDVVFVIVEDNDGLWSQWSEWIKRHELRHIPKALNPFQEDGRGKLLSIIRSS